MYKNFQQWIKRRDHPCVKEWADFGFSKQKDDCKKYTDDDQTPLNPFDVQEMFDEMLRMPSINSHKAKKRWADTLEWGQDIGALLLDISPLGSFKITIRRKITDLQGEMRWICKKIISLNERNYNTDEGPRAVEVYEAVKDIGKQMIDSPKSDYEDFHTLVRHLFSQSRLHFPSYCMFSPKIKQINENYYKIYFDMKGHGVESPSATRVEQFNIDILMDKEKGLIRCWGYDVKSPTKGHKWEIVPSEWDEWYAPSQPIEEIVDIVINTLLFY